jgi:riboflavin kinase / FMN adenylyltransferase
MSPRPAALQVVDSATRAEEPCVLVVGNFDGVHLGHKSVLEAAVMLAQSRGLSSRVLTFDPHPAAVVGSGAPPTLTTFERRAELMGELGVDRMFVQAFDAAFAGWEPERFARELVAGALAARVVVVGQNFRFGAGRVGDLALLQQLGSTLGFEVSVHPTASDAGGPFSSTRAREAIVAGNMEGAAAVLGRPHSLSGVVVHGDERGRTIEVPTANLDPVPEILPPDGVYAVHVDELDDPSGPRRLAGGVTNIGMRPTVTAGADGQHRTVETYLLGFSGDIYDLRLRLHVVARLRDEMKFASLEELKLQIIRDCAVARRKLGLVMD